MSPPHGSPQLQASAPDARLFDSNPDLSASSLASPSPLGGRRLLVADDAPDNRRLALHFLRRAGATVETVENGRDALERALAARDSGTPFHIVLMDIQMPLLDGLSATRLLRAHSYSGCIIAVTANVLVEDRLACFEAGCNEYQPKPVDWRRLIDLCVRYTRHLDEQQPA